MSTIRINRTSSHQPHLITSTAPHHINLTSSHQPHLINNTCASTTTIKRIGIYWSVPLSRVHVARNSNNGDQQIASGRFRPSIVVCRYDS
jgi:hypothetical protein